MKIQIIYEDKQLLVIYKPEGFPAQSARVTQPDVVSELSGYLQRSEAQVSNAEARKAKPPYVGLVHRLDQPVEGLMVVAKTKEAAADLSRQITDGELKKTYLAVVYMQNCGKLSSQKEFSENMTEMTTLTDDMYKDSKSQTSIIIDKNKQKTGNPNVAQNEKITKAVLHYRKIGTDSDATALMEILLETGRFHQIRAQMAHAEMPLLGDVKYGSQKSQELSKERNVRNVALCAYKLSFLHPKTKKAMQFKIKPHKPVFNSYEF